MSIAHPISSYDTSRHLPLYPTSVMPVPAPLVDDIVPYRHHHPHHNKQSRGPGGLLGRRASWRAPTMQLGVVGAVGVQQPPVKTGIELVSLWMLSSPPTSGRKKMVPSISNVSVTTWLAARSCWI